MSASCSSVPSSSAEGTSAAHRHSRRSRAAGRPPTQQRCRVPPLPHPDLSVHGHQPRQKLALFDVSSQPPRGHDALYSQLATSRLVWLLVCAGLALDTEAWTRGVCFDWDSYALSVVLQLVGCSDGRWCRSWSAQGERERPRRHRLARPMLPASVPNDRPLSVGEDSARSHRPGPGCRGTHSPLRGGQRLSRYRPDVLDPLSTRVRSQHQGSGPQTMLDAVSSRVPVLRALLRRSARTLSRSCGALDPHVEGVASNRPVPGCALLVS